MTATVPFSILAIRSSQLTAPQRPVTLSDVHAVVDRHHLLIESRSADLDRRASVGDQVVTAIERVADELKTAYFHCPDDLHLTDLNETIGALGKRSPRLRVSLGCRLDDTDSLTAMALDTAPRVTQIQWRLTHRLPDMQFFKSYSQAGIWNHLELDENATWLEDMQRVSRQPHIIHSWEGSGVDGIDPTYGRARPLPGEALWRRFHDPVQRFLLVDQLTKDRLLRMRIDADGEHIYVVGEALDYRFFSPDQLPTGYLDDICAMVAAGGTVATTHVRSNLERAYLIGVAIEKGVIVGNSSLKNPRPAYVASVLRRSGLDLTGFVERGYTSVRPEYRGLGIGTRLLAGLTRRAGNRRIFSVIGEDNAATQIIARRNRTRKVASYFSPKAGKTVGIWMPVGTVAPRTGTP